MIDHLDILLTKNVREWGLKRPLDTFRRSVSISTSNIQFWSWITRHFSLSYFFSGPRILLNLWFRYFSCLGFTLCNLSYQNLVDIWFIFFFNIDRTSVLEDKCVTESSANQLNVTYFFPRLFLFNYSHNVTPWSLDLLGLLLRWVYSLISR